ncbi:MAG: branched-chain amino acid ABC transporter permease [Ruminococcaceae bacterium]|nr:branched-chain amino acid ABC transporter permease [Oscillospiraceae bacterium]
MSAIIAFFKKPFIRKYANYFIIALLTLVFGLLSATGSLKMGNQFLMEQIAIAVLLAVSLGMVVGFLGELSLGHAGFMCAGAFIGGKIAQMMVSAMGVSQNNILVLLVSLLVGGLTAALFGFIIGLPALRLRGDYLAIVTLAFGEIVRAVVMNLPDTMFGGTLGVETPRFDRKYFFVIALLMVLVCLAVTQNLMHSKHGRAIISIKDNEIAAKATGIDITRYKLFVFTISSFFAGVAGVLYSYTQSRVQSATFDYNYSIEILVMVVLGGMGSINGSMIAAALITFINVKLQTVLTGNLAVLQNVIYALILIAIVIYRNAPGLKGFREKYNSKTLLAWLKKKLGKGKVADAEATVVAAGVETVEKEEAKDE